MANEELAYRLAQVKYYVMVTWDKLRSLPTLLQALLAVIAVALAWGFLGGGFAGLTGSSETQQSDPNGVNAVTTQTIPDLSKKPYTEALQQLKDLGFTNVKSEEMKQYSGTTGDEIVINQVPGGNQQASTNTPIVLSYGSKAIYEKATTVKAVPAIANQTLPKALDILKKQGFTDVVYTIPQGESPNKYIVTGLSPLPKTKVPLNTRISLTVREGLNINEFRAKMAAKYVNYKGRIAKVDLVEGRSVHLYMKNTDPKIKSQAGANEAARIHKVTMEQVLGEQIDRVLLTVPGKKWVGDSTLALRSVTTNGLAIDSARNACEQRASQDIQDVEFNWSRGLMEMKVFADHIKIAVWATSTNDNDARTQMVIHCEVAGTNNAPEVTSFRAD